MNGWAALRRFLTADPVDAGCTETFAMLDRYAECALVGDAERRFPAVAAHLRVCVPCAEDLKGLLELMREAT